MQGIKFTIALLTLLITSTATAMTETYLQAIQKTQERSYAKAAYLFRSQLQAFADNPIYRNRTRVWFALTLLAEDDHSREAEVALHEVLCETLTAQDNAEIANTCPPGKTWGPTTEIDTDIISAAAAAYGAIQWRRSEYKTAIQFLNLAIQRALNAKPVDTNMVPALKQLDSVQPANPEEAINKEQNRQALIQKQLMTQLKDKLFAAKGQLDPEKLAIDPQSQQALVESYMSEMFARKQKELVIANPDLAGKAVPGDLQSLLAMQTQGAQQFAITQQQKVDCINTRLAEYRQKVIQEVASGELDNSEAIERMRRIGAEGVPECDETGVSNAAHPDEITTGEKTVAHNAERKADKTSWGRGKKYGSFGPKFPQIGSGALFTAWETGDVTINIANHSKNEEQEQKKQSLALVLNESRFFVRIFEPPFKYPVVKATKLVGRVDEFLSIIEKEMGV